MISLLTKVQIIDNSGAIEGRCIKILRPSGRKYAKIGDMILVSIIKHIPGGKIHKGEVFKALIVRTKTPIKQNSFTLSFNDNAAVLVKLPPKGQELIPVGTRFKGPLSQTLKYSHLKLTSLAKTLI